MGEALERYFASPSYEKSAEAIRSRWDRHTLVPSTVKRWVHGLYARAGGLLTAVTRALAELQPEDPFLTSREIDRADARHTAARLLAGLETFRRASEGARLGRGFHQRRFEFYNLWAFRQQQARVMG
jgi:hypothetical protein